MTPEEKRQFQELKREVERLRSLLMTDFVENMDDKLFGRVATITDGAHEEQFGRDITVTIGMGSDDITVLDYPDKVMVKRYKGQLYLIPLYNAIQADGTARI